MKISHSFSRLFLIALVLACFALCPTAEAVLPEPDGGYPGGNTAEGTGALQFLTTGSFNTANGFLALASTTTGVANTANGHTALYLNGTGSYNTATGVNALLNNATGRYNTADGYQALYHNTSDRNTATGAFALNRNTSGAFNTANGYGALNRNSTGAGNAATGYGALFFNNADQNSAFGTFALLLNTGGADNCAFGLNALALNSTGSNNIALGSGAGSNLTVGNNNIDIGNRGVTGESNAIRIGTQGTQTTTYVAGISGTVLDQGIPVVVDTSTGQLGITPSAARFKEDIRPMDKASEAILALKPVTFHYKKEGDPKRILQFGLVAEEVEKVNRDLVVRDKEGKPYSVRYEQVNAMLLNEFLKEHRKVEEQSRKLQEQESTIAQQRKDFETAITELRTRMETVVSDLKVHDSKIQKVRAQIERRKPIGQTALNNP